MLGFKSFADKTGLNFMPGITAIVGPNGCGKSNVSDALRWVLGEQSAKALRGGEMADVIFNGTDNRKGLGMAEVSLTIGGIDQEHLRAVGVDLEYDEVTLTRRVFRDGASEYFLNKTACRLKDIQQLFMGTGMGRNSYSIMAQGHITQLLSSRPEDRRIVFEEAAGITRFKAQKKEAMRKLEYTEQNLLRVADLIREVKRQIGSLQRQAGKARRYKQLRLELEHLDTQLARHQFDVLQAEIEERHRTAEGLRTQIEDASARVLSAEEHIAQLRQRQTELEHEINQWQQQGLSLKAELDRHEGRIHFNEERLRELEQQNAKALADIAQAEERCLAAQNELAAVNERLASSTAAIEQLRQTLETRQDALRNVEADLRAQQDTLRQSQSNAFAVAQQLTRARNEITALDLQKQNNAIRLEKLSAEKIQLEEERNCLETRVREFDAGLQAEQMNVQTRRLTVEEQRRRLGELQQELNGVTLELDEVIRQQTGIRSRCNVLEQLQAEHEGLSAGTLAALKQAPETLGALVDSIRVPASHLTAIEAALGHNLQLILTEKPDTAQAILADLKSKKERPRQ
ncbi:MAG: AAA family ATPase, partial [Candidatus Omnitrophica bacterium]|nr:AAA family ATPase [Candidatus Omnitrophota bacterium]